MSSREATIRSFRARSVKVVWDGAAPPSVEALQAAFAPFGAISTVRVKQRTALVLYRDARSVASAVNGTRGPWIATAVATERADPRRGSPSAPFGQAPAAEAFSGAPFGQAPAAEAAAGGSKRAAGRRNVLGRRAVWTSAGRGDARAAGTSAGRGGAGGSKRAAGRRNVLGRRAVWTSAGRGDVLGRAVWTSAGRGGAGGSKRAAGRRNVLGRTRAVWTKRRPRGRAVWTSAGRGEPPADVLAALAGASVTSGAAAEYARARRPRRRSRARRLDKRAGRREQASRRPQNVFGRRAVWTSAGRGDVLGRAVWTSAGRGGAGGSKRAAGRRSVLGRRAVWTSAGRGRRAPGAPFGQAPAAEAPAGAS